MEEIACKVLLNIAAKAGMCEGKACCFLVTYFAKPKKSSLPVHVLLPGLPVVHRLQLAKENLSHRFLRKKMNMIVRYQ